MKFNFKKSSLLAIAFSLFGLGLVGCNSGEIAEKISGNEAKIASLTTTVNGLNSDIAGLKTQVAAEQAQLNEYQAVLADVAALQTEVGALTEAVEVFEATVMSEETALTALINGLKGDLQAVQTALAQLKTTVDTKVTNADVATAITNALAAYMPASEITQKLGLKADKASLEELVGVVNTAKSALETLQGKVTNLETAGAALQETLTTLNAAHTALATKVNGLETTVGAKIVEIEGRITALESAKTVLEAKVVEHETALATLDSKFATMSDKVAALEAALAIVDGANGGLVTRVTNIEAKLAEFGIKFETIDNNFETVDNTFAALNTRIDDFEEAVAQLVADAVSHKEYANATALLIGNFELSEEQEEAWATLTGAVIEVVGNKEAIEAEGAYSLAAWDVIVNSVKSGNYSDEAYEGFKAYATTQKFFLGRDLTVGEIVARFEALKATIVGLPTIEESFYQQLETVGTIELATITEDTDENKAYASLLTIHEKLVGIVPADADKLAEAEALYTKLVNAYENLELALLEAEDLADAYADLPKTSEGKALYAQEAESHVYSDLKTLLGEKEAEYFVAPHSDVYPEGYGMKDLVEGLVDNINTIAERAAVLLDAVESLDVESVNAYASVAEVVFGTDNYNSVVADWEAFLDNVVLYELDGEVEHAENLLVMYKVANEDKEFATGKAVYEMVVALDEVYAEKVTENEVTEKLLARLEEGAAKVEYTDKEELLGYATWFAGLQDAIAELNDGEAFVAANYAAMKSAAEVDETVYDEIKGRLAELDELAEKLAAELEIINGYYDAEEEKFIVKLTDFDSLFNKDEDSVRARLNALEETYEVGKYVAPEEEAEEDLLNNKAMTKAVELAYIEIANAYDNMAKDLKEAVLEAQGYLEDLDENYPLLSAANVEQAVNKVGKLIVRFGLTNQTVYLDAIGETYSNVKDLLDALSEALNTIRNEAIAAQAQFKANEANALEAVEIDIESMYLNNEEVIELAYNNLVAWVHAYAGNMEAEEADAVEYVKALLAQYEEDFVINNVTYTFYTNEQVEKIVALFEAWDAYEKEAKDALDALVERLKVFEGYDVGGTFSIHDKAAIDTLGTDLTAFVEKYYDEAEVEGALKALTIDAQDRYVTMLDHFDTFYANAKLDAKAINDAIDALADAPIALHSVEEFYGVEGAIAQAEALKATVLGISNAISEFKANYDRKAEGFHGDACEDWFGVERIFKLNRNARSAYGILAAAAKLPHEETIEEVVYIVGVSEEDANKLVTDYNMYIVNFIWTQDTLIEELVFHYSTYKDHVDAYEVIQTPKGE